MNEDSKLDYFALNELVVNCPNLTKLEEAIGGFNIFQVLKFEYGEIRHSNVLAWLLDPAESHGLDDSFLKKWLMRVLHESPVPELSPIDIDAWTLLNTSVRREWKNIDLLIEIELVNREKWVVCVENKVNSTQHSNQLARYRKVVESQFGTDSKLLFLFLTKNPEEAEDDRFIPASYDQVHKALDGAIRARERSIGNEPATLIRNYLKLLEEKFMNESEIARIAQKIYQQHRRALDIIFEHRPDNLKLASDLFYNLLEQNSDELGILMEASSKSYIRFIPKVLDIPENSIGSAWPNCNRLVVGEINLTGKKPYLMFVAGKAPREWVAPLWERGTEKPFSAGRRAKELPMYWVKIHVHPKNFKLSEEDLVDTEAVAKRMFQWASEAIRSEQTKAVVSEIRDHFKRGRDLLLRDQ
ncbi:PD-(D/E)XK nuclease family protein [Pelagicoccus sp. SDUM812005]|uniref:PDDEXK-like family protein n=1 Tax=Pelagicoccus sp. SDUM812005 TaxID=3041257 RepID=UPI00280E7CCB|nr:PD-(D/E)XK nuclease family protein [Pelagicoccus sp. SDUM812005]MDQ8180192.1 PD-(D/E)XK nuclease family protein [Pelagicoccus sp. SDUM812005]